MEKLEKIRKNIYTSLVIFTIPLALYVLLGLIFLFSGFFLGGEAVGYLGLFLALLLAAFAYLLEPLLILTFVISFIFFIINVIKYFKLKKQMIENNTYDESYPMKKYIYHRVFFYVSVLLVILIFSFSLFNVHL